MSFEKTDAVIYRLKLSVTTELSESMVEYLRANKDAIEADEILDAEVSNAVTVFSNKLSRALKDLVKC